MADKKISQLSGASTPLAGTEVLPIVQGGSTVKVAVSDLTAGRAISSAGLTSTSNITLSTNATYFRGVTTGSTTTRMLGITNANTVYIGSIDTQTAGGVIFINGTEFMNVDTSNNVTVSAGNLKIGTAAKGIDFSANTHAAGMTSELLNWYEEGTWTPNLVSWTVSGAATISGTYTRIGRLVTVFAYISHATSTATTAGTSYINALPFVPANNSVCCASTGSSDLGLGTGHIETGGSGFIYPPTVSLGVNQQLVLTGTYYV